MTSSRPDILIFRRDIGAVQNFCFRDIILCDSMKDPLPVVRKRPFEILGDFVTTGRWSETREYFIPMYMKPQIV